MALVLSGCPAALDQDRYTLSHDSVLSQVEKFISQTIGIYCDAGGRPRTIPPDIVATSERPDLVIVIRKVKTVIIFKLTVAYEKNVKNNHQYKCYKYAHLVIDLLNIGFKVKFCDIEIGCRGLISMDNSSRLDALCKCYYWL